MMSEDNKQTYLSAMKKTLNQKIRILREKLLNEKEMSVSTRYFSRIIMSDTRLYSQSESLDFPQIKFAVRQLLEGHFRKTSYGFLLNHVPRTDFVHGACRLRPDVLCVFFFYRDLGLGLVLACSISTGRLDEFKFAMISPRMAAA
jgi:hypothetical protein